MFSWIKDLLPENSKATILRIYFGSALDFTFLDFDLYQNDFVQRWKNDLSRCLRQKKQIRDGGFFYGSSLYSSEELIKIMTSSIECVHRRTDERIKGASFEDIDQNFLNALHKEFERVSAIKKYWPGGDYDDVDKALIDLNAAIHQYEVLIQNKDTAPSPYFSFDVNFSNTRKRKLLDDDFKYFTPDVKFGEVYLDYATVGVPVLNAYLTREVQFPVPQREFKPDFRVSFDYSRTFDEIPELRKWVREKYNWDPDHPKLAVGAIPLGLLTRSDLSVEDAFSLVSSYRNILRVELH